MRTTLSVKHATPAELAKNLRSLAAKLDADALTPGADIVIGNTRVQVATQESDIRAWARANEAALIKQGIPPVRGRGRYSKALQDAYAKHLKEVKRAENKAKREAAAERKAAREAAKLANA